ncbi:uncharacterized protein DNG_06940 [Cephalotrichum gorgonifer]|uniref:Uncharacterized protein n=1 Tax=Cephalotrichum gorgonifer TaxID=2041049 RepID=A0AAE8N3P0_9PEZI|nr:uncharacterized protein DNG_06940 [Cephalotrichum gorgonifer]
MGKKKTTSTDQSTEEHPSATTKSSPTMAPHAATGPVPSMSVTKKEPKSSKGKKPASPFSPSSPLVICRNKHWRYIACFHGPWLQMPIEILETMANVNYNTPRPHPIDPAVFYDAIKIRKLVEEATDLAVRAASDVPLQGGSGGYGAGGSYMGLGGPGPGQHGTKLSRERKYRINLQACQKLARAYRLDEIACSVATMQGASTLDDIGSTVLQRNRDEVDGKYVHFFHEKIPSRQLADHTSLQPLNEIISECPTDPEPYRTRAMIRGFMLNFSGAISDFTKALDVHRVYGGRHEPIPPAPAPAPTPPPDSQSSPTLRNGHASGKRPPDVRLREEDQPSSLVPQLLFMRACAYLALACDHVRDTIVLTPADFPDLPSSSLMGDAVAAAGGYDTGLPHGSPVLQQRPELGEQETLDSRKTVKTHARRALKDFLAFLSHLEYTPHMPQEAVADFTEKIGQAASGNRNPRHVQSGHIAPEVVYQISDLFSATPPTDIPPYPPADSYGSPAKSLTVEACTYHPLLTEALHSLLLCHCLLQTSRTELIRHAHNVARLARIADAYPVFQASRSAARADFVDILEKTELASSFARPWDALCAPAPLPSIPHPPNCSCGDSHEGGNPDLKGEGSVRSDEGRGGRASGAGRALTRWSVADDGKEYPIVTDRALLIARWITDVPFVSTGTAKKKRRTVGKGARNVEEGGKDVNGQA